MRITLAMLCVLAASVAGFSQETSFDLSKYKFPDYKRHELELSFGSSGQGDNQKYEYLYNDSGLEKHDDTHFKSNSNATLGYTYEKQTRTHIDFLHSSISGLYDYSKETRLESKSKDSNFDGTLNVNGSSRYYLTRDKLFIEGLANMWFSYSDKDHTGQVAGQDPLTDGNKSNHLYFSPGLGVGIGRIEKVNDLWQAYFILEKLNKQKSLNRELQEKDIFEFATLASQLKNKRFFDARLRKIGELKALDSLLHRQGLIDNSDIGYFTTLNDYWSYGNFPDRRSGSELKFQLMPEFQSGYWKTNGSPSTTNSRTSLISKVQYDHTKQLNLHWERSFQIIVSNSTLIDEESTQDHPSNFMNTEVLAGIGFYPDSRTSLKLSGGYEGYETVWQQIDHPLDKTWNNNVQVNFNGNYYISPQLQLTANLGGRYAFTEFQSRQNKVVSYGVGLRYAIF